MNANDAVDSRLMLALDLLRSALQMEQDEAAPAASPGRLPFVPPPPISSEEMSATDLLTWWFRPVSVTANPWDDYFARPLRPPGQGQGSVTPKLSPLAPPQDQPAPELASPLAEPASPWIDLEALVALPEERIADEHAEAAINCLYEFVHALARLDVDAAMACVAEDYHVLEDDREHDKLALRRQIESLLDSLRGWELEVSLAEIPMPVFHPNGILIYVELQIGAYQPEEDLSRFIVDHRVAVFEYQGGGERPWMISALSPVKPA